MEVIFACPACQGEFNNEERLPLFLGCGHTLCRICIQNSISSQRGLWCPIDEKRDDKEDHPINYALLQNPSKAGIRLKERCEFHGFPVSVLCHTCNAVCCPQCLLEHRTHQLIHVHNPYLLNSLQYRLDVFEDKFLRSLKELSSKQSNINREIAVTQKNQSVQEAELETHYSDLRKLLETKRSESLNLVRSVFDDKRAQLTQLLEEPKRKIDEYSEYLDTINTYKKELDVNSCVDRAIPCSNLIRRLDKLGDLTLPQALSMPLRVSSDHSSVYPFTLGNIKLKERSPLDLFSDKYFKQLAELESTYNSYVESRWEVQLSLEVQSVSFMAYLLADDSDVWRTLVLMKQSHEVLGRDLYSFKRGVIDKVLRKVGVPRLIHYDFSLYTAVLRKRIAYAQGLVQAMNFVNAQKYKGALELLHHFIIKGDSNTVAENFLDLILLRMCSEGFLMVKQLKFSHANELFMLVTYYLKFHRQRQSVLYRQVFKSLIFYRNKTYVFTDGNNYTRCLHKLNECIGELEVPCDYDVKLKCFRNCELAETDLVYWEDTSIANQFLDTEKEFSWNLHAWKQALLKIQARERVLSDAEQLELESHLINT